MGNFEEARKFNGVLSNHLLEDVIRAYSDPQALLIEKEPTNLQAQSLGQLIDRGVARGQFPFCFSLYTPYTYMITTEGYIGMALVGGAAAVGTLLIAGLIRRAARK
jgi:fission 1 protein